MQRRGMSMGVMAALAAAALALIWYWVPAAFPIVLGLIGVVLLFLWRRLAAVQFYFEQPQPAEPAFPLGFEDEFAEAARELTRQGFVPLGRFVHRVLPDADDFAESHWFANATGDTLVQLQPPNDLDHANHLVQAVFTQAADGRLFSTGTVSPVMRLFDLPDFPSQILAAAPLAQVLHAHRQWLHRMSVTPAPWPAGPDGLTPEAAMALVHAGIQRQMQQLQALGRFAPDAQGGWRLRGRWYGKVLTMARAAPASATDQDQALNLDAQAPATRWTPTETAMADKPTAALSAQLQPLPRQLALMPLAERQGRYSPTPGMQLLMLVTSALVFTALGAWFWSPAMAVAIAAVVLVHELGHWAAMRAFGWQHVQLVLLPLLGGVATGFEQQASARQRVWVTLAGPLPGIVLAFAALYGLGDQLVGSYLSTGDLSWPLVMISVALFLNYLNLLPFPPLDGGQLLRSLWPQRWRGGEWLLLGALWVLGLGVSIWQGWTVIAILVGLQWPSVKQSREDAQLLNALPAHAAQLPTPELDLLILTELQARQPTQLLKPRLTRALALRQAARLQPLSLGEGLLVLALWLGAWAWAGWLVLRFLGLGNGADALPLPSAEQDP